MGYTFVRQLFLLYETVEMLYKFTNRITFQSILNRQQILSGAAPTKAMIRRINRLQEILDEVCKDLNPDDPFLRQYFGRIVLKDDAAEENCLAGIMLEPFGRPTKADVQESIAHMRQIWQSKLASGVQIQRSAYDDAIAFVDKPDGTGDLFAQILKLKLPAEVRLYIYEVFRDFEGFTEKLSALLTPLADRLATLYQQSTWLLDEVEAQWQTTFEKMSPREYVQLHSNVTTVNEAKEDCEIAFSLMNCKQLVCWMIPKNKPEDPQPNFIYLGCCIDAEGLTQKQCNDLESIGSILRAVGDKKKLEVLRRLSKEQMYLHELAEIMNMDPGGMSRTLNVLHNYGFLQLERQTLRNYYQTDREAVHNFLALVEDVIFS